MPIPTDPYQQDQAPRIGVQRSLTAPTSQVTQGMPAPDNNPARDPAMNAFMPQLELRSVGAWPCFGISRLRSRPLALSSYDRASRESQTSLRTLACSGPA